MINNINPYQGMQNAIRPGGSNTPSDDNRMVLSSGRSKEVLMPEVESYFAQAQRITQSVNVLQNNLDVNQVSFPPFFPIATYQRMDLIVEVRSIQQNVERSSLSAALKQSVADTKLNDHATDDQITNALDKVLALRNTLSREMAVSKKDVQPGSILKLEV